VGDACQDHEGKHRFVIVLPYGYGPDSKLDIHGIRVVDGVSNDPIAGSGKKLALLPAPEVLYPGHPPLSGAYRSLTEHPRVFTTAAELKDLAARINRPQSYSMQRFGLLATKIKADLASGIDWDVTYSGCDGNIYQFVFSYEPQAHHEAETRAALQIAPDAKAPMGAAVGASRLALYAALVKAGATVPPGAPSADDAAVLAKRILLAWANRGFPRDAQGRIVPLLSRVCAEASGEVGKAATTRTMRAGGALELGRGVLYSVHAQDLLQFFHGLNSTEESQLNAFHGAMFELLRHAHNQWLGGLPVELFPRPTCVRYGNVGANTIASLLAAARLLDDGKKFNAVLVGGDNSTPVLLPWIYLFDYLIYGESDTPPPCLPNPFPDSLTSLKNHQNYASSVVAPGEIFDRVRSESPGQAIGYVMFTLERLFDSAEVMRIAGFDPYGYRGAHKQSIEMAMQYYACYAKGAGFYKIVTAENSGSCPNAAQYFGKLVNDEERILLMGAYRFPKNKAVTEVEMSAKAIAYRAEFSNDAILFGKWRD
jgi:hypothetical protein